jgi:hypothetical protein
MECLAGNHREYDDETDPAVEIYVFFRWVARRPRTCVNHEERLEPWTTTDRRVPILCRS